MRNLMIIFSLSFFFITSLAAQESKTVDMTKTTFSVELKVTKTNTFKIESFTSSWGQKVKASILDAKELAQLKLKPGTLIKGRFRFDRFSYDGGLGGTRFASEGGLGTTRVANGKGRGKLTFSNITGPDGRKVACPPLCTKSVRLGLKIGK